MVIHAPRFELQEKEGCMLIVFEMLIVTAHESGRRGFNTLIKIKNASFPSPIDVGSHNPLPFGAQCPRWHTAMSTPFRGLTSSLAYRSVSDSDTIYNSSSQLLTNIFLFGLSLLGFLSRFLKPVC